MQLHSLTLSCSPSTKYRFLGGCGSEFCLQSVSHRQTQQLHFKVSSHLIFRMPIRSIIRTPTRPHACRCPGACAARNIWPARKGEVTGIPPHSAVSECSVDRFRACQPVHLGTSTREGHTQDLPTRPGRGLQLGVAIASMLDDVDDGFASLLRQHHQPPANLERPRRLWPPSTDWVSLPLVPSPKGPSPRATTTLLPNVPNDGRRGRLSGPCVSRLSASCRVACTFHIASPEAPCPRQKAIQGVSSQETTVAAR
ncbi:hypothetical protein K456DRAFT_335166 [Colletotrichum gloeosporioides 23]|nr:hypothetical protein K456DRAFT_335166 [Colletotrichum gloeosporioides 23]